ncbi:MAG: agmatinase [Candidatus Thiodiazotropha sp. (ex Monitilora ramsayi)]|nr:agmatinase [Candidatus Thiodiazotropha sp. (ex Monitilora ramsayi)]
MSQSQSFLSLPNAPVESADALILPVPYERTVTYKPGTRQGPAAILAASDQLEFYEEDAGWCPTEYLKLAVLPSVDVDFLSEQAFHDHLHEHVKKLPGDNLLIALGGEHSVTPEMVFARMPQGGTVVQIDAHADLRPAYHGSIYNHACPMNRIRQREYELIQIGIRSLHANEAELIAQDKAITTYFDRTLQRPAIWERMIQQLASLQGPVWLTIDMDGFDPALIAGVGTPQPGGLSWHQGVEIIETLMGNEDIDICGVDILELVPEPSRVSDMMGAKLVQKCLSFWGKARGFHKGAANGSQIGVDDE